MTERLVVYRVRSWRHADCYLPTLEAAVAHARRDLDCARPGEVAISRHRVSRSFWDGLSPDCDHPEMEVEDAPEPEGEQEAEA